MKIMKCSKRMNTLKGYCTTTKTNKHLNAWIYLDIVDDIVRKLNV